MSDAKQVYEDEFGAIIVRPGYNEIRWYDATASMTAQRFKDWLSTFAGAVEDAPNRGVLVDATSFLMDPGNMDGPWRDANIIPRYNGAGRDEVRVPHAPGHARHRCGPDRGRTGELQDSVLWHPRRRLGLARRGLKRISIILAER